MAKRKEPRQTYAQRNTLLHLFAQARVFLAAYLLTPEHPQALTRNRPRRTQLRHRAQILRLGAGNYGNTA